MQASFLFSITRPHCIILLQMLLFDRILQIGIYRSLERTVIASQCAHWRGNLVDFREALVGRICRFSLENAEKSA